MVFFDQHEELCIPRNTKPSNRYKYLLARTVLIRHLQVHLPRSQPSIQIESFESVQDPEFEEYLTESGVYFVLCHDGADLTALDEMPSTLLEDEIEKTRREAEDFSRKLLFRTMICSLINQAYNVALINGLEWMDTKVRNLEFLP